MQIGVAKPEADITVPLVIDDVKRVPTFEMTRCNYFCIQCDTPAPGWFLQIAGRQVPFLIVGLTGVIHRPAMDDERFDSPQKIDDLFDAIEAVPELYVDQEDVWIPNRMFDADEHKRGSVYRIGLGLFRSAYNFRNGLTRNQKSAFAGKGANWKVSFSRAETEALSAWGDHQIAEARRQYRADRGSYLARTKRRGTP